MKARELVDAIAEIRPENSEADCLRFALLLTLRSSSLEPYQDRAKLDADLQDLSLQLNATTDQHAAVSTELDSLAETTPCEFSPQHMWTLVKALKVQSQILNFYLGS